MFMELNELLKKRYATKLFNGEKISNEQLENLKEVIRLTPSSFNLQPWKVKIIDDKETLNKLQIVSWNQPQIGTASHLFVFCYMKNLEENKKLLFDSLKNKMPEDKFDGFKGYVENYFNNNSKEDLSLMSQREVFMALENLMISATEQSFASCPMGGFDSKQYQEILNIPDNLVPVVVCPVGIAADEARPKFRFDNKDIFF